MLPHSATLFRKTASRFGQAYRGGQTPRLWQPQIWLYVPLYLALCIALGAACRALAHFITNPGITIDLWSALLINCCISFGVQCGGERVRRWSHRLRVLLFLVVPLGALFLNNSMLAPLDAEAEINANVALFIGWSALMCVLLAGSHYGRRRLPFAAPLVPGLSLFGLLNSLSVDTLIQICFLIFVAAALYIVVYEPMLHRMEARLQDESAVGAAPPLARRRSRRGPGAARWNRLPAFLSRPEIVHTAVGYLAACSVWFTAFMAGAALFYYPVAAVLPRVLAAPFGGVRSPAAALLDWRGSSSMMELRGGDYPLSDRIVMQVVLTQDAEGIGSTPVLWRGRTFEHYETSHWFDGGEAGALRPAASLRLEEGGFVTIPPHPVTPSRFPVLAQAKDRRAAFSPRLVHSSIIEAYVEPQRPTSPALYFPGTLVAIQSMVTTIHPHSDGSYTTGGFWRNAAPYALRASVKQERISGLLQAPGLTPAALAAWKRDDVLAPTLELTPALRSQLAPIVASIRSAALRHGRRLDTPYAKANAIRDYLVKTCTYSLSSPLVPATEDAVVFFMTKSKRGACDMFASSMALLLRAMDVPARLATGYIAPEEFTGGNVTTGGSTLAGDFASNGALTRVTQGGTSVSFALREKDAHAWVEYFIPGAGWLTYDPTAGTRTTQLPLDEQIATLLSLPKWRLDRSALWLPLCGLLLIGIGLGWSYFDASFRHARAPQTPAEITRAQITEAYNQAVRRLRRHVPLSPHLTPREYESAVNRAALPAAAKQEFAALTYLLVAARYGGHPPAMSRDELQASLRRLRRSLR